MFYGKVIPHPVFGVIREMAQSNAKSSNKSAFRLRLFFAEIQNQRRRKKLENTQIQSAPAKPNPRDEKRQIYPWN